MNTRAQANLGNPTIWLSIDPQTVKQRIDRITEQLERVRHRFESQIEASPSYHPKEERDRS